MKTVLSEINRLAGVQGCLLIGKDGLIIASDLSVDINDDAIGAMSSNVLAGLERALERMNLGRFTRYIVTGRDSRVAMYRAGPTILLVLMDKEANLGLIALEIREAIQAIEKKASL